MSDRRGGARHRSRQLMRKPVRQKGKLRLSAYFATFQPGERVVLYAEPAYQRGMYNLRFHGRTAVVEKQRGKCYELSIRDGGKMKSLVVHPIHLRKTRQ